MRRGRFAGLAHSLPQTAYLNVPFGPFHEGTRRAAREAPTAFQSRLDDINATLALAVEQPKRPPRPRNRGRPTLLSHSCQLYYDKVYWTGSYHALLPRSRYLHFG